MRGDIDRLLASEQHKVAFELDVLDAHVLEFLESLRNLAASHPLLMILEDLHDADRGTLDLLVYLARHLVGTPLLMVGTYRDVDVDRAHPLAAAFP